MKIKILLSILFALVLNKANSQCILETQTTAFEYIASIYTDTNNDGIKDHEISIGKTDYDGNNAFRYRDLETNTIDYQGNIPHRGGSNDTTNPIAITADEYGIFISAKTGINSLGTFYELRYYPFFSDTAVNSMNVTLYAGSINNLSYNNGKLTMQIAANLNYYDKLASDWILPLNTSGANSQHFILQTDGNSTSKNWVTSLESDAITPESNFMELFNGNLAVPVLTQEDNSEFREYDNTNGTFVQTHLYGNNGFNDVYTISGNYIFKYDDTENKTYKYDQNFVFQFSTIWEHAHFNRGFNKIRQFDDGSIIVATSDDVIYFENNLIHKFVERVLGMDGFTKEITINDDKTVSFINQDVDDVKFYKASVTENMGNIPSINTLENPEILSVFTGQKPVNNSLTDVGNYQVTVTSSAENIPAIGTTPPISLISPNGDTENWIAFPVTEIDGVRQFRALTRDLDDGLDAYIIVVYWVEEGSLSVEDVIFTDFRIYPNPAKDVLNISTQDLVNRLSIYDISGGEVISLSENSGIENINVENLSTGFYMINVKTTDGKIGTKKLIIK